MARSSSASVWPAATGNGGRIGFCTSGMKAQRRAITAVLSQASGISAKRIRISAADLK